jgi:biopolymer transport protein TolQ
VEPVIEVFATGTPTGVGDTSIVALLLGAGLVVQLDLLLLVAMSVICWGIILQKFMRLRTATQESAKFLDVFWKVKRLDAVYEQSAQFPNSPVAEVFRAGYQELAKITSGGQNADAIENLTRTLRRAAAVESTGLERYVTFLATTGSTAPFIGLFGTVWGILQAFQKLGTAQQATIQVVGPDIAHALIATAVGLVAAIPAVMAYNFFNATVRVLNIEMDNFSADFLNIVKRHLH